MVRDTARALFAQQCPTTLVREHMADPGAADPLWEHLRDWVALADGPLVDLCLFLEESGSALLPGVFFPTVLARLLVEGVEAPATVAIAGADGLWVPNDEPVKTFVLEADRVDRLVLVDVSGVSVVGPAGVKPMPTLDSTRRCFSTDEVAGAREAADVAGWLRKATVALAADMLGTARALLDRSVAYARERVQFGVPIGTFQAIQHKLADVALEVERATAAVYYAAMCIDADDGDRERAAHVAKAAAGAAATRAAKDAAQVHGGIGYTWEHDLHLFIRRAYVSENLLGSRSWHHDRLADLLF